MAVDGRIDEGVVDEGDRFLGALIPSAGIVGELAVKFRVRPERVGETRFVVRATAHPSVGDLGPLRYGVALCEKIFPRSCIAEEFVRVAARSRIRFCCKLRLRRFIMK